MDQHIVTIYEASIRLQYTPQDWRVANIIPLRKPKKGDYTLPNAYRPISLLSTLGKGLEAVVAKRISYLIEKFYILLDNHFGARLRRLYEQALNILIEKIYAA